MTTARATHGRRRWSRAASLALRASGDDGGAASRKFHWPCFLASAARGAAQVFLRDGSIAPAMPAPVAERSSSSQRGRTHHRQAVRRSRGWRALASAPHVSVAPHRQAVRRSRGWRALASAPHVSVAPHRQPVGRSRGWRALASAPHVSGAPHRQAVRRSRSWCALASARQRSARYAARVAQKLDMIGHNRSAAFRETTAPTCPPPWTTSCLSIDDVRSTIGAALSTGTM